MMKKTLVFATNNKNKAAEIQSLLGNTFIIKTLSEVGVTEDIPETGDTLEENAKIKSTYIHKLLSCDVFSDDTGLEVSALNGAPGVYSARYAGPEKSDSKNMSLLINKLSSFTDKRAQFRTVISLYKNGQHYTFQGIVKGTICNSKRGESGFGYDPIFIPIGSKLTFAEMDSQTKNSISHRGQAIKKMIAFLLD